MSESCLFNSNALKASFFNELYSWCLSGNKSVDHLSSLNTPNSLSQKVDSPNKLLSFRSRGEYSDYWCDLIFADLRAKINSYAVEAVRRHRFCNLFVNSSLHKTPNNKINFKLFIDHDISSDFDLSRLKWVCLVKKTQMDEYIPLLTKNSFSAKFPQPNILCCITNLRTATYKGSIHQNGLRKAPPVEVELEACPPPSVLAQFEPLLLKNSSEYVFSAAAAQSDPSLLRMHYNELVMIPLENMQNKLRQFSAVINVGAIDLCEEILCPSMHNNALDRRVWKKTPQRLKKKFKRELNRSQYKAIKNAIQISGISMLEGPPGTGKTRTVIALINLLHINAFNEYYASLLAWIKRIHFEPARAKPPRLDVGNTDLQTLSLDNLIQNAVQPSLLKESTLRRKKPRLLVCAPSNAAVDEIITRLAAVQLFDNEERLYTPRMVRIGNSSKIRDNIQHHLSLSQNVEAFFGYSKQELSDRFEMYRTKLKHIEHAINERKRRLAQFYGAAQLPQITQNEDEAKIFVKFYEDRHQIRLETQRLRWVQELSAETAKSRLEKSFVEEAEIVFSTLNGAGGKEFRALSRGFDFCIVDEAAQCIEPDLLIPLQLKVKSVILVGDHQQLPPTVFLTGPKTVKIERSMFERFQVAGFHSKHLLTTQYRMHPEIAAFPSEHFYDNKLKNGKNVLNAKYCKDFHKNANFGPYLFYDLESNESRMGFSLFNQREANFVCKLLEELCKEFGPNAIKNVGVITPYKEQLNCIRSRLNSSQILRNFIISGVIEIATVDFFQGREKNIVILSCVRASKASSIGFVSDVRRLNVSLTRAKNSLWVIGNSKSLERCPIWKDMVSNAKLRGRYRRASFDQNLNQKSTFYSENGALPAECSFTAPNPTEKSARNGSDAAKASNPEKAPRNKL